jgi:Tol biopolymer transport system component
MDRRRVTRSAALIAAALGTLVAAAPAQATFPGANGRIAFTWSRGGDGFESGPTPQLVGVVTMRPDGSGRRLIARGGTNPVYSPGGNRIAFVRKLRLWVAAAGGRHAHAVTPAGWAVEQQRWSPAGTRILFVRASRKGMWNALYTVRPDGTGLRRLVKAPTFVKLSASPWSPNGKAIAYTQVRFNSKPQVRIIRGGRVETFVRLGGGATWSRHGLIAYGIPLAFSDMDRVCLKRAATGETVRCFGEAGFVTGDPDWAPDGTRLMISHSSIAGGATPERRIVRPDGTVVARMPIDVMDQGTPIFSPDGTRLAFTRYSAHGMPRLTYTDLHVALLDGSARRQLTRNGAAGAPDWQPRP